MSPMAHEPHVLLGAHVLGGLSRQDEQTFLEHLRWCDACWHELTTAASLREVLARLDPVAVRRLADGHDG